MRVAMQQIKTPRGSVIVNTKGTRAEIVWNPGFAPKWNKNYVSAQQFVDSEVLRRCAPYMPLRTGMMIQSGTLGTVVGSGVVQWIAPYTRGQYYRPAKRYAGGASMRKRGPRWFVRMMSDQGSALIATVKRLAGGGC